MTDYKICRAIANVNHSMPTRPVMQINSLVSN